MTKHTDEILEIIKEIPAVSSIGEPVEHAPLHEAVAKIEALTAPRTYKTHEKIKLIELEGELVEITIHFEDGTVKACGRVILVLGGAVCDAFLWVGEACVPVDAVVYYDSIGKRWVFKSTKYNYLRPVFDVKEGIKNITEPLKGGLVNAVEADKRRIRDEAVIDFVADQQFKTITGREPTDDKRNDSRRQPPYGTLPENHVEAPIDDPFEGRVHGFPDDGRR